MSTTAVGFVVIYGICLVLAFRKPIFGIYAYLWSFYNPPPFRWWGEALPEVRWSLIAALVTWLCVFLQPPSSRRPMWFATGGGALFALLVGWIGLQNAWAVAPTWQLDGTILWFKYLLLFFLIYQVITDEKNLEWFFWGHVVGCFIFGCIAYLESGGGRFERIGGAGVNDSNSLAMHLTTGLIIAGFLALEFKGIKRWVVIGLIPFILNGILLTASRGAIVGLVMSGFVAWYLKTRAQRWTFYAMAVLAMLLFLFLAQDEFWWNRMASTSKVDEYGNIQESSAASRIEIIKYGVEMALDHPLGVGFRGHRLLSRSYMPEYLTRGEWFFGRSAHNTFMAVWVEQGIPGLLIFVCLLIWAAYVLFSIKAMDKSGLPTSLGSYRAAIGTALASWFFAGQFTNFFIAEVYIWFIAVLAAFSNICQNACGMGTNTFVPERHWQVTSDESKERAGVY